MSLLSQMLYGQAPAAIPPKAATPSAKPVKVRRSYSRKLSDKQLAHNKKIRGIAVAATIASTKERYEKAFGGLARTSTQLMASMSLCRQGVNRQLGVYEAKGYVKKGKRLPGTREFSWPWIAPVKVEGAPK